ncbi:hypothetical protein PSEUBRA_005020 [Kalmanozyma brasiliensis GHG001]|uniref:uncharacterized protein n=1 Tax=Kalmanozyma brasiliensis (strain GHG001) TaxID=1365824 RepID=UPI0028682A78|nr:uncharacterized protein PSEUBRA_005020 [Kalmanozyma brasiliensis GHG001]KAF6767469.1 hypothetical protein PSEUBRA_005020 [Kalmanozyma brasiliensis GHG001]
MAKVHSLIASATRKGEKKRKHPSSVSSPPTIGQDETRLQLDDILSSLPGSTKKHTAIEHDSTGREEKKAKKAVEGSAKGGEVSALDLLLGTGGAVSKKEVAKKGGMNELGETSTSSSSSGMPKVASSITDTKKRKTQPDAHRRTTLPSNASSSTKPMRSADATSISTPAVGTSSATPLGTPASPSSSHIRPPIEAAHTLKALKQPLRLLISTLQTLESEQTLVDRMWYKNRAQFRSALWWVGYDGVRRSLRRLLPSSSGAESGSRGGDGEGRGGKGVLRGLVRVYAGLGGVDVQGGQGWVTIPKFDTRPTADSIHAYLSTNEDDVRQALYQLAMLERLLHVVRVRAETAGSVMVTHLNTPPAPTFAPVVTGLLALVAGVHAEVERCVAPGGATGEIGRVLRGLLGQGPDEGKGGVGR